MSRISSNDLRSHRASRNVQADEPGVAQASADPSTSLRRLHGASEPGRAPFAAPHPRAGGRNCEARGDRRAGRAAGKQRAEHRAVRPPHLPCPRSRSTRTPNRSCKFPGKDSIAARRRRGPGGFRDAPECCRSCCRPCRCDLEQTIQPGASALFDLDQLGGIPYREIAAAISLSISDRRVSDRNIGRFIGLIDQLIMFMNTSERRFDGAESVSHMLSTWSSLKRSVLQIRNVKTKNHRTTR